MRNVSDQFVKENKTHFMFNNFSQKSGYLQNNVEKYGRTRQATNENIIQHMYIASKKQMAG